MSRILYSVEGVCDQLVVEGLVAAFGPPNAVLKPKQRPATGLHMLLDTLEDTVRASCFGHFDALIVHVDANGTTPHDSHPRDQPADCRECLLNRRVEEAFSVISYHHRPQSSLVAVPVQSMEAWLEWGLKGQSVAQLEATPRQSLKHELFGRPPQEVRRKTVALLPRLIDRLRGGQPSPRSLHRFCADLNRIV